MEEFLVLVDWNDFEKVCHGKLALFLQYISSASNKFLSLFDNLLPHHLDFYTSIKDLGINII